jgi:hypothetical protein
MTVEDFLALPKRLRDPTRRLRDEINRLRREITVEYTGFVDESEKRCCGKLTFATEQEALAAIIPSRSKKSQKPMRAYRCSAGYWHLSGQPKKKMSAEIKYFKNNS